MKNKIFHNLGKAKNKIDKTLVASGAMLGALAPTKVFASGFGYTGMSGDGIMSGAKATFVGIASFAGGLWAIAAIFTLILAVRNEDNEGRNKSLLNLVCAIALLMFGIILGLFGL